MLIASRQWLFSYAILRRRVYLLDLNLDLCPADSQCLSCRRIIGTLELISLLPVKHILVSSHPVCCCPTSVRLSQMLVVPSYPIWFLLSTCYHIAPPASPCYPTGLTAVSPAVNTFAFVLLPISRFFPHIRPTGQ